MYWNKSFTFWQNVLINFKVRKIVKESMKGIDEYIKKLLYFKLKKRNKGDDDR